MPLRRLLSLAALLAVTGASPSSSQTPAPPKAPVADIQAGTQLVVVDVVVQDKDGHPVHGLKVSDFQLSEGKAPQTVHSFEEHTSSAAPTKPEPPLKLPPGTFTNYTPVKPNETLNVLLLDALNTPTKDQAFVRDQLQRYVKNAPAGTHLAIFGLTTRLTLLQSFTSDPEILKDAVQHKLIPRASALLDDPAGTNSNPESLSDQLSDQADSATPAMAAALAVVAANVADFEARTAAFQTSLRVQYTLDAFNTLARYLAAFQGRKNLIWFSGSFPITILPDPDAKGDPFAGVESKSEEFRQTSALLSRAQVAVYPVDARGLMTNPAFDVASSGPSSRNPRAFATQLNKFTNSQADEHGTMSELAQDTGGHAFYNTNGLADAVAKAIDAGSNYYTLTYTPSDRRQDGGFRNIHVDLGPTAPHGVNLSYRRGYFASDARHPDPATALASASATPSPTAKTARTPEQEAELRTASAYADAAMARGGPTPQDILFKVRVLPAIKGTEPAIAPGNVMGTYKLPGPYQRFAVDFVTLPSEFGLRSDPNGNHSGGIEFLAYVYTSDGRLINSSDRTVAINLVPENYKRFLKSALEFHLEVSSPARTQTFLRIAVRDMATNRFGVVEIPASAVSSLPPPVYPSNAAVPNPASPPATPVPAATAPSNPVTAPTAPAPPPH